MSTFESRKLDTLEHLRNSYEWGVLLLSNIHNTACKMVQIAYAILLSELENIQTESELDEFQARIGMNSESE